MDNRNINKNRNRNKIVVIRLYKIKLDNISCKFHQMIHYFVWNPKFVHFFIYHQFYQVIMSMGNK